MHDETSLVSRTKDGDHEAFKELYESSVDPLYRFLKQFSADTHQVEEWVQRSFIKAYEHIGSFQGRSRFATWLFRIGLNEMRSDKRRGAALTFEPVYDGTESTENESGHFEWSETMKGWLDQLDEAKRTVFILYEVEGYSHAEIASLLNVGESTSRTLLSRAKHWLKRKYQEERSK